ncbi:MAG TPA: DUF4190 domain-containing protein [Ktedonobacterales bacterium]|nr:DUF4190 domain-containing protein [Ktedonobacterales bacterium]HEX5571490.1 DUF4190 domain-containing protein [Ktedonobacterales bacterium]
MTTPYGDYPNYQPPTGPTTQQEYPSQPYQPYPSQEQPPYQGSYPPPPPQQPQAGYAQPYSAQYPQQYAPTPGYPPPGPTSGMAIASLVCSLLGIGLVGVILGHLALNEINKSNGYTQGRGLAIAGLIIGYLQIAAAVVFILIFIIGIAFAANVPTQ